MPRDASSLGIFVPSDKIDGLRKSPQAVTPAKAGVQNALKNWIPAFAGMTENVTLRRNAL